MTVNAFVQFERAFAACSYDIAFVFVCYEHQAMVFVHSRYVHGIVCVPITACSTLIVSCRVWFWRVAEKTRRILLVSFGSLRRREAS